MLADYIKEKPTLHTPRLILRTLTADDVADLLEWTPDKNLYTYWGKNAGKTDKNPELLFSHPEKPSKSFHWGIALSNGNKVIGELWIYLIESDRMAKVAYRIAESQKGNGYATEALQSAITFCFENTEL